MKRKWKKLIAGFVCGMVICTNVGLEQVVWAQEVENVPVLKETEDIPESEEIQENEAVDMDETFNMDESVNKNESEDAVLLVEKEKNAKIDAELAVEEDSGDTAYTFTYDVNDDGTATITGYEGTVSGNLMIPEEIDEYKVTSIGSGAFEECSSLKSVDIPSSVTSIEFGAFSYCRNLINMIIPFGVTSIGIYAFSGCSSLTKVSIPSSVTSIGTYAFSNCSGLKSAGPIGGGYNYEFGWEENIPSKAFEVCGSLTSVSIPYGVTSIGSYAFSECSSLTSVIIPSSVTEIGENAFFGCDGLTSLDIPSSVVHIGNSAFYGCGGLKSVNISSGVRSIGGNAFESCDNLTSVTVPSSVTSMGYDVFCDCSGLKSAGPIGSGCNYEFGWEKAIPGCAFFGCSALTSLTIPPDVTTMGPNAVSGCSGLKSAGPIGGGYDYEFGWKETIPSSAFGGCSGLTSVSIPSGVTKIDSYAFWSCRSLTNMSFPTSVTSIGENVFDRCSGLLSVQILNLACQIYDSNDTIPENVTIYGYANSTAESYAEKYKRTFVSLGIAEALPVQLTASKEKTEYKTGEILNVEDITATITYTDGTTKTVTGFTTNVSEIDMSVAGKKILVITYRESDIKLEFNVEITVKEASEIVEPKFYTVIFDANGGTGLSETNRTVEEGKTLGSQPEEVKRAGYTFTGWYKEPECKTKWNFDGDIVTGDTVLYAGWEPVVITYTVSFDLQGHGSIEDVTVVSGNKIKEPSVPALTGYIFIGWYKEAECNNKWDFDSDIVEGNITLYAGWESLGDVLPDDVPTDGEIQEGEIWTAFVEDAVYTGKAIKPEVHIYWGKERLDEGIDYTLKYKNNTQANDASNLNKAPRVEINYKKHFPDTKPETIYFKINPVNLDDVTADDLTIALNQKVQKKVPTAIWCGRKLSKGKDFDISYPDEGTPGAYQEKGTYDILLTAGKNGNFTGSKTVSLTITDLIPVSKVSVKIKSQLYDKGNPVKPEPKITYKGTPLEKDKDYTIAYKNNTEIGTATAIVTGTGKYEGTKKVTFKITGTSVKKAAVTGLTKTEYNGFAQIPDNLAVTLGGKLLKQGEDYNISFSKNRNAGKATVIISGKGVYTGTVRKIFRITPYDLKQDESKKENRLVKGLEDDITISLSDYQKGVCKPEPTLTFQGRVLRKGRDYTISYRNNKKAATAADTKAPTIVIKGKGNFKGTIQKAFTITE